MGQGGQNETGTNRASGKSTDPTPSGGGGSADTAGSGQNKAEWFEQTEGGTSASRHSGTDGLLEPITGCLEVRKSNPRNIP